MSRPDKERILVIKHGALGDFIQALGPMRSIRQHHPKAHITLMTTAPFMDFAKKIPYCDDVFCDERPRWMDLARWWRLRQWLRNAGFTRVYDLQNSDRTDFYLRLFSAANRPEWVGRAKGASHRNADPARTQGHAFEGHCQTLARAGITDVLYDDLAWMHDDVQALNVKPPYALIVAGSSPQHLHKRWPVENYIRVIDDLKNMYGVQSVLLGTRADAAITHEIIARCPSIIDLTQKTSFFQLAVLARGATLALGNDTGPMHLIAATGCPTYALFSGRSNAVRHAPKGANVQILQENDLQNLEPSRVLATIRTRLGRSL